MTDKPIPRGNAAEGNLLRLRHCSHYGVSAQSNSERLPRKVYCPGRYVVAGLGGSCGGVRLVLVAGKSWDCYFGPLALRSRGGRLCRVVVVGHGVMADARRLKRKSASLVGDLP
jgi:hypothetical protein